MLNLMNNNGKKPNTPTKKKKKPTMFHFVNLKINYLGVCFRINFHYRMVFQE